MSRAVPAPTILRSAGKSLPLLAITLAGFALRFWRLGNLVLVGDESYYWLWSRFPDWAYFDHPAGVALLIRLSTVLPALAGRAGGGQSEMAVRWLNALLGTASIPLVYLLGAQMLSRRAGLVAAAALAVAAPYLLISRFVYTDSFYIFLLLVNLYFFWLLIRPGPTPGIGPFLAFGLSLALLFNTKYSAYLYAVALLAAVGIDHRRLLRRPAFWASGLIAALGLLPVLLWNASHQWASLRWQLSHASFNLSGEYSPLGNLYHALGYLTWPLVLVALLGFRLARRPPERLLSLIALFLLVPVILSPANSPRNLTAGLIPLLLLAGMRWPSPPYTARQRVIAGLLSLALAALTLYGLGTLASLGAIDSSSSSRNPALVSAQSSAVAHIRRDVAGWRTLGPALRAYPQPRFALDYGIAAQIAYYTGEPAYTAWGQYRIWGIPDLERATILSLTYLPETLISGRLREVYHKVTGPAILQVEESGATREVRVWQAEGMRVSQEAFLQQFDFLALLEASR